MTITYSIDIEPPQGWVLEPISDSSLMLLPLDKEQFADDGLVPSVLAVAAEAGPDVLPLGNLVARLDSDLGGGSFRSSISAGADESVAFFQIVSVTSRRGHELVVTATASHAQASAVADAFDLLCGQPISFGAEDEEEQ